MRQEHPTWDDYQRRRWMRTNAHLYVRHDADRYMKPGVIPPGQDAVNDGWLQLEKKGGAPKLSAPALSASELRQMHAQRTELLRLKWQIAALRFERALILRTLHLQRKANFNPNQPRVPAGNPDGGQWTSDGGGGASAPINDSRVISDASSDPVRPGAQYAELKRPGIGHNKPPSDVKEIPKKRPATVQERNLIAKLVAQSAIPLAVLTLRAPHWLLQEHFAEIRSYRDPPKSFEELQQGAVEGPKAGYQIHHVGEQTAAEKDGIPRSVIDAPENLVRIPTRKHREISGWYQTKNPRYGNMSPRDFLRGKSWETRRAVGIEALIEFGVLKP